VCILRPEGQPWEDLAVRIHSIRGTLPLPALVADLAVRWCSPRSGFSGRLRPGGAVPAPVVTRRPAYDPADNPSIFRQGHSITNRQIRVNRPGFPGGSIT
jgi:hypothetical protein